MTAPTPPAISTALLRSIRLAILVGALFFGGTIWWLRRESPPPQPTEIGALRFAGYGLWVVVLLVLAFVRGLFARAGLNVRPSTLLIVSWAAAESLALFGGVVWFLHGDSRWYTAGMLFMLATFIVFPVTRD